MLITQFSFDMLLFEYADLESQSFGLHESEWLTVDFDEAISLSAVSYSGRSLLLAEALNTLRSRHGGLNVWQSCGKGERLRLLIFNVQCCASNDGQTCLVRVRLGR